jgi:predicted DNA-binding ribbon-helix-helix protein
MPMRVKTTLELERPLYLALKKKAAEEKKTLKKVMDEIIVAWMSGENSKKKIQPPGIASFPSSQGSGC